MTSRRFFSASFSFLALFLGVFLRQPATAAGSPQTAVQAAYTARDDAFRRRDIAGTLALYSPEVLIYDTDGAGSSGTAGLRADLSKLFAGSIAWSSPQTTLGEFTADKSGKEATVKAVRHLTVTSKTPALGGVQTLVVEETVRDHWVSGKTGWRITQERRLSPSSLLAQCSEAASGPAGSGIVGLWSGYVPTPLGVRALMTLRFRENGLEAQTLVSSRQKISIEATYTTDGDHLTETLTRGMENGQAMHNDGIVHTLKYRVESNDTLYLVLPGADSESRFSRQPEP